jgi:hypothetical protein
VDNLDNSDNSDGCYDGADLIVLATNDDDIEMGEIPNGCETMPETIPETITEAHSNQTVETNETNSSCNLCCVGSYIGIILMFGGIITLFCTLMLI